MDEILEQNFIEDCDIYDIRISNNEVLIHTHNDQIFKKQIKKNE